ncbi:STAS/SEC14 domain-containing protein [Spirosoma taeanense]|uniref:STAS/SEC14 domain-containing protein n=1 Tax=Spirosoma taeanense TaxID=2735870 RepID=A0A6M5YD36_9BACT|nr:STAS/SEC14 domain-containing protein [Spirosoma taeanense]QJW91203.1 STAS/SEC14 domain-containing protein [Spirosoma taeanense]
MIQLIDFSSNRILGFRLSATITEDDIRPWAALLDQKSNQHDKLRAYIEFDDVGTVTLKAAFADLKFDLTHLGDFEKAALVADQSWTSVPTSLGNLVPGLEARQFSSAEKEQARQWIQY